MQIDIPDTNAVLPQYLRISATLIENVEWQVHLIRIFADPDYVKCLAEDISLDELPKSSQMAIYAALDAWLHTEYQRQADRRRELAEIVR